MVCGRGNRSRKGRAAGDIGGVRNKEGKEPLITKKISYLLAGGEKGKFFHYSFPPSKRGQNYSVFAANGTRNWSDFLFFVVVGMHAYGSHFCLKKRVKTAVFGCH